MGHRGAIARPGHRDHHRIHRFILSAGTIAEDRPIRLGFTTSPLIQAAMPLTSLATEITESLWEQNTREPPATETLLARGIAEHVFLFVYFWSMVPAIRRPHRNW